MSDLDNLIAHVEQRIAASVPFARHRQVAELVPLIVRHWPHAHLDAVLLHGRNHKAIDHAMVLMRAQVREQWEARHGIGPVWQLVLAGAVESISLVLLDLWFSGPGWRGALKVMARQQS